MNRYAKTGRKVARASLATVAHLPMASMNSDKKCTLHLSIKQKNAVVSLKMGSVLMDRVASFFIVKLLRIF